MINSLRGKLICKESNGVVVECGGVGFGCTVSSTTLSLLSSVGEEVFIYTYLAVREDNMELYGFAEKEEYDIFKLIISVNGIGPGKAIQVLSSYTASQLIGFIASGDEVAISKANGIGKKMASRIVLELKDKVGKVFGAAGMDIPIVQKGGNATSGNAAEAIDALVALGFSAQEASKVVARIDSSLSVEEIIKIALTRGSN